MTKLNLTELLNMIEENGKNYNVASGGGKHSLSIVNNINGKRITLSKTLSADLNVTDEVYFLPVPSENTLIVSSKSISSKSASCPTSGQDGKKICYAAGVVKMITETFALDYSNVTSLSFNNIGFDMIKGQKVALIDMTSKKV